MTPFEKVMYWLELVTVAAAVIFFVIGGLGAIVCFWAGVI